MVSPAPEYSYVLRSKCRPALLFRKNGDEDRMVFPWNSAGASISAVFTTAAAALGGSQYTRLSSTRRPRILPRFQVERKIAPCRRASRGLRPFPAHTLFRTMLSVVTHPAPNTATQ